MKLTNYNKLVGINRPIKKIITCYKNRNTIKATEKKADNLCSEILIYIRARIILTTNL
jgi:hypothetical protein